MNQQERQGSAGVEEQGMQTAGMIEDTFCATVGAALDVAAHGGGAAVKEVADDPVLIWG